MITYLEALFSLTKEMAPYLLLGFLIAGLLHVYVPRGAFTKYFGKNNLKSVIYASMMGIPLPLCSCGVIPTGISFYKDGASKGATVSFLISTPQTGVDSIMVTYSLLGLPFAIIRPIIALITSIAGGFWVNQADSKSDTQSFVDSELENESHSKSLISVFKYAFDEFLEDIADWLVIGLVLAGLIAVLVPADFFQSAMFQNELLAMSLVLIASIPFYVCATGSVPIAAVLLMKGLNPGAVLVFLMAGPATNIATITVIAKSLGKKTLTIYLTSIILGSFLFGLAINHLFPSSFFVITSDVLHQHGGGLMGIVEWISVVLFVIFILRIYLVKLNRYIIKRKGKSRMSEESLKIEVSGMSCQNCAVKVESVLMGLNSINESHANFSENYVELKGNNINLDEVKTSIENAGYTFKEKIET